MRGSGDYLHCDTAKEFYACVCEHIYDGVDAHIRIEYTDGRVWACDNQQGDLPPRRGIIAGYMAHGDYLVEFKCADAFEVSA